MLSASTVRRTLQLLLVAAAALLLAGCTSGPDLNSHAEALWGQPAATSNGKTTYTTDLPVSSAWTDFADRVQYDDINQNNDQVWLLYRSGTVWLRPDSNGQTAITIDPDNRRAYRTHSTYLGRTWNNNVSSYSGGFRGGGTSRGGK